MEWMCWQVAGSLHVSIREIYDRWTLVDVIDATLYRALTGEIEYLITEANRPT